MDVIDIFGKDYSEFCEIDPYNTQNKVAGYISRKATEYYGALFITHINEKKVSDQLIMGTPKMHYPFHVSQTGERKYCFPVASKVEIYEKLDGTNILAFSYSDGDNIFYSFKTRLMPFVNASSRWGNFFAMWNEVAGEEIDEIRSVMNNYQCNLSFELYGLRNPHLVIYDVPLAYALLFGVTNLGNIIPPIGIQTHLPKVELISAIDRDYNNAYLGIQKQLQDKLKKVGDDTYAGVEGAVWYFNTLDKRTVQYKCKPDTIEMIHFSQGKGISKNSILSTCWNALENTDKLTVEFIKQLLLEEFEAPKIEANHYLIEQCIGIVRSQLEFRDKVLTEYKAIGINISIDKVSVMRSLSGKFPKNEMSRVYAIIINWG